jgi:hypothetical protein
VRSDFPFPTLNKQSRKFESLDIWKLLNDGHSSSLLPWYFAVSTNRMPAKYLISKSISCNVTNLSLAKEEVLWEEHRDLIEIFLKIWKEVRSGQVDLISNQAWRAFLRPLELCILPYHFMSLRRLKHKPDWNTAYITHPQNV